MAADMVVDMKVKKVDGMVVDMEVDMVADLLMDMKVDKVAEDTADMVADMEVQNHHKSCHRCHRFWEICSISKK